MAFLGSWDPLPLALKDLSEVRPCAQAADPVTAPSSGSVVASFAGPTPLILNTRPREDGLPEATPAAGVWGSTLRADM